MRRLIFMLVLLVSISFNLDLFAGDFNNTIVDAPLAGKPVQFLYEEFAPFSYTENGVLKGVSVETLKMIWNHPKVKATL